MKIFNKKLTKINNLLKCINRKIKENLKKAKPLN